MRFEESTHCPDWRSLMEERDRNSEGEVRWRLALEHAGACESCRGEVVSLDPLSVFALSAVEPASDGALRPSESEEIESMLEAVTTIRRYREADPVSEPSASGRRWAVRAAAAAVVVAGLAFGFTQWGDEPIVRAELEALPAAALPPEPVSVGQVTLGPALVSAGEIPALGEELPPAPRVYQWQDRELSVVMIVDETLDV